MGNKCYEEASNYEASLLSVLYIIEPGDVCKWTGFILFQVMACCLSHITPLLKSVMKLFNFTFKTTLKWNLNQIKKISFQEDPFEISYIHSQLFEIKLLSTAQYCFDSSKEAICQ